MMIWVKSFHILTLIGTKKEIFIATYLEHANITVPDIDAAISFLMVIDPAFKVRADETPEGSVRWVHIGTEKHYIALQEPVSDATPQSALPTDNDYGVNYLGWVVDDFDAMIDRLEEHGYKKSAPVQEESYRKQAYYYDSTDLEWEIVHYLSDKPEERKLYEWWNYCSRDLW